MKSTYLFVVAIVLCYGIPVPTSDAQTSQTEIFLLAPGIRYQYEYYRRYFFQDVAYYNVTVDSGTVDYVVLDSSGINDTTRSWLIQQRAFLMHHMWSNFGYDSLYWTSDSTTVYLQEGLNELHELRCASIVWQFPLSYPSQAVLRYADTSSVLLARNYYPPTASGGVDSLWFSSNSGFSRRYRWWESSGHIQYWAEYMYVRLLARPVVYVKETPQLPNATWLLQNYPNPFNAATTIRYTLPADMFIVLRLYDLLGREVMLLDRGHRTAGTYRAILDGSEFSSGTYFYRLTTDQHSETKKAILLR